MAADLLVFGAVNPTDAPSFMLIVGFLLLSATVYFVLDGLVAFIGLYGLPARHRRRVLRTAALVISGILALQSMGQLSARDIVILMPLTALLYFYLAYSKSARRVAGERSGLDAPAA